MPPATSLDLAGAVCTDRDPLLRAMLRTLADWYGRWRAADGDPVRCGLREAYREHCLTLGGAVSVTLPGGEVVVGTASDVDGDGRLVVATAGRAAPAGRRRRPSMCGDAQARSHRNPGVSGEARRRLDALRSARR